MNALVKFILIGVMLQNATAAERFAPNSSGISFFQLPGDTVFSSATRVEGRALAHTSQFFPFADNHELRKGASVGMQTRDVLQRLNLALRSAGTTLRRCVKLNIYLAKENDRDAVRNEVAEFVGDAHPAVCFVAGNLAFADALVAMDAVAVAPGKSYSPRRLNTRSALESGQPGAHVAVMSVGRRVYVSGQAVRGTNTVDAARKTMAQLEGTLHYLGLNWSDVVQVKSFLDPIAETDAVARAISKFFGEATPPQVFVEWTYQDRIEIELIVDAGARKPGLPRVDYITPKGMKASPVFCRVTRINEGPVVYVSGISGGGVGMSIAQVFAKLEHVLKFAGSDMRHLVKATYYVNDNESSRQLNTHRSKIYDPVRPPAASKAPVRNVGAVGSSLTLDMIGVAVPD